METTRRLVMAFADEDNNRVSLTIEDPKSDLLEIEIKDFMEMVVAKNVFAPNGVALVSALEAKIVVTDTTPFDLVIG
ncbi:MAG: DUF2922 domain-containing protein [Paraclostridium sp.]